MINYKRLWQGSLYGILCACLIMNSKGMYDEAGILFTVLIAMVGANILAWSGLED